MVSDSTLIRRGSNVTRDEMIRLLNEDLSLAFRAHVQTISNLTPHGAEQFERARRRRIANLGRRAERTVLLARQIEALDGLPTTEVAPAHWSTNGRAALTEELALDNVILNRLRHRAHQAEEMQEKEVAHAIDEIAAETAAELDALERELLDGSARHQQRKNHNSTGEMND